MRRASKTLSALLMCGVMALLTACGGKSDVSVSSPTTKQAAAVYNRDELYQFFAIAFNAAPGVTYLGQLLDAANAGLTVKEIVNIFTTKPQFTDVYPTTLSDTDFAKKLVANVVGSSASTEAQQQAINDIVAALRVPGWTRGDVIFAVFTNLANKSDTDAFWAGTSKKMKNQVIYARYYTETMQGDTTVVPVLQAVIASVTEITNVMTGIEQAITTAVNFAQNTNSIAVAMNEGKYFAEISGAFPDLAPLFSKLCGYNSLVQTTVAVDLNKDGRKDLILDAWCDLNGQGLSDLMGTPYNGSIPNTLILLLQQNDGSYVLANKQLFGSDLISFAGPGNLAVGDLNNDGFIDIVVAPSKEDGRNPVSYQDGTNNYTAPTQVLLSKSDGTYVISNVGPPTPGGSRLIIKDDKNHDMLVFDGYAYKYVNEVWELQPYTTYYGPLAFFDQNKTIYSINSLVESPLNDTNFLFGLRLAKQNADQSWGQVDLYAISSMKKVPTVNLVGQTLESTNQFLTTIGGQDWLIPSIAQGCMLNGNTFLGLLEGIPLDTPYASGQVLSFNNLMQRYTSQLLLVQIQDEKFSSVFVLPGGTVPNNFYLSCQDVNMDGKNDIVVTRWGDGIPVVPYIYLASGNSYIFSPPDRFPTPPSNYRGISSYVVDMDDDGLSDIIYLPILGMQPGYSGSVNLKFFKGIKALN